MRYASFVLALALAVGAVSLRSGVSAGAAAKATAVTPNPPAVHLVPASLLNDPFQKAVGALEGTAADPYAYPATLEGFNAYLKASGVQDITADELTRPNHPEIARRLGYTNFVPPQKWWNRGAALALLTQGIQRSVGAPVHIRNWWRPEDYNRQPGVDGAKASDHITATALDLDYDSPVLRAKAEQFLRSLQAKAPWLNMSLGLGAATTHVGLLSPRGQRHWYYSGYTAAPSARPARGRA